MEILGLIAAIVGLVWGGFVLHRGGLLAGLLLVMLAGVCFSLPFVKLQLGPLPLTIDRLLLPIVVAQYLVWRRFGGAERRPMQKPEWLLVSLTVVVTLSAFSADWTRDAYQPLSWLILYYWMPLAVYVVARQTPLSPRAMTVGLTCVTAFAVYLSLTTLAEWCELWTLVFPRYIAATAAEGGEWIGRGRGPLLHPIGNGVLLTVCLAAVLCWWPHVGRQGKAVVALLALLVLAALYATLTRSVWMGGLFAVGLIATLTVPRHWRLPLVGGGLVVSMLLAALMWESLLSYKRERHLDAGMAAESAQLRPVLAAIAWRMFLDRPLLGCGYAQYPEQHVFYTDDRSSALPLEKGRGYVAHNTFLALLTETGLIGLGLFVLVLGLWGRDAWRLWTTPDAPLWARQMALLLLVGLGAYLVNGMFHDMSVIAMGNMTLFLLAGLTAGLRQYAAVPVAGPNRRETPEAELRLIVVRPALR
jgi:O-antigen ligase